MDKIVTCLWFDHGQARHAAEFYASVFPDSHVGRVTTEAAGSPGAAGDSELTVEFTVLERDDQAETDHYWNAIISNGGREGA